MIQYIKSLFKKKTELGRYLALLEKTNNYYSKNSKAILSQCGGPTNKTNQFLGKDDFLGEKESDVFLFFSKGSRMEN